jgi:predicted  nucleic acid-binding Zn-ribbon protein
MKTTPEYNSLIDEMLLALTANIEYLKTNGSSQIRIKNGQLVSVLESGYIYSFQLERLQDIDVDADVEIRVGSHSANGKVTAINDDGVMVTIDEHLGDNIASAMLIISSYYLLERLREYLSGVKSGEIDHSDIAEKVFKLKASETSIDTSYHKQTGTDEYQEKAIQLVLGSEVSFIWGPPGTGKSATIARLIEELIERGNSVLLIAHTNAATDSVMTKVVELMEKKGHPDYLDGRFLRIGKKINAELKTKRVVPEVIMEEKARPIREEIESLRAEIAKYNQRLEYIAKVETYQKTLEEARQNIQYTKANIEQYKDNLSSLEDTLSVHHYKLSQCEQRINEFQQKGSFSRIFAGTNLDKLTKEKSEYLKQIINSKSRIVNAENELASAKSQLESDTSLVKRITDKLDNIPVKFSADDAKRTRTKIKNYDDQITALEKQLLDLSENLLLEAKVIATTLTQTYTSKSLLSRKYDVVILDEASMAPLPAVASVSGIANKKIALVGDFFQLPPIAKHQVDAKNKSDEEAHNEQRLVDRWLKQDIFGVVGIEDAVVNGSQPDPWLSQLRIQYRMHPDISELINDLVYGKNKDFKLLDGPTMKNNGFDLLGNEPLTAGHVGICDTTSLGSIPTKSDSGSWYNLSHALASVELAKQAIKSGYERIGIISAYRAQINLINQIIKDELGDDFKKVEADTVHRFQGGAKQIVIFDVTTPYTFSMYDDAKEGGDDAKLINVAFSRAEEKCIILVDRSAVVSKHSATSLIKQAIGICDIKGRPKIDAKTLLDDYFADDRTESWLEQLSGTKDVVKDVENAQLHDERDFYPLFMKDLMTAKQEVIIQSAYITMTRLNTLLPIFQMLISRGVRIFVLTRVPWENDGYMQKQSEEALPSLEKLGVTVLPFIGKIHQKFAIIDRFILWDGSLNILSQRDSGEVMRRYEGEGATTQYIGFMRLDKNIGPMGGNILKHCAVCTLPGSWMWTKKVRGRMWTFCLTGNHSASMEPKTSADRDARNVQLLDKKKKAAAIRAKIKLDGDGQAVCPEHARQLINKHGRFGSFWECPLVKECACTISDAQLTKLRNNSRQTTLG